MRKSELKIQKRNQIIMAVILVSIMVLSMFGIMLNQGNETIKYNGIKFEVDTENQGYLAHLEQGKIFFSALPESLENVEFSSNICNSLKNSNTITILFDPTSENLNFIDFIRLNIQKAIKDQISFAITETSDVYPLYPVGNCSMATPENPILFLNYNKNNTIVSFKEQSANCFVASAKDNSFIILRDRLLYCYYGVME